MANFNLGTILAAQQTAVAENRDIEIITGEILEKKKTAGEAILEIGKLLIEAKAILPDGEWLSWLADRVEFSPRTAQRFMRLSREWTNATTLSHLGASKALALLALPPEEREAFIAETHEVDGEPKTVIDMSARQLEAAIKERDEARMAAEKAVADSKTAEAARQKMESDMAMLKELLETAKQDKASAEGAVADLERQLAEVQAAPVDVAVMEVDQEMLAQAKAEAVAGYQAKLDKAKEAKSKADEKRKAAEEALAEAEAKIEAMERAEKKATLAADKDMATFEVLFNQGQALANQMQGILIKARGREDETIAGAVQRAMRALADAIGRAAE